MRERGWLLLLWVRLRRLLVRITEQNELRRNDFDDRAEWEQTNGLDGNFTAVLTRSLGASR